MQMDHSLNGSTIGRSLFPASLILAIAAAGMTGLILTVSVSAVSRGGDTAEEGAVVRCDRLAAVVVQSSTGKADSVALRRQYEQAFRACLDDVAAFQRLVGSR